MIPVAIVRPTSSLKMIVFRSVISASDHYLRPIFIIRAKAIDVATIVVYILGRFVFFGGNGLYVEPGILGERNVALNLYMQGRAKPMIS